MKTLRRQLCALLVLILCIGLLPGTVARAGDTALPFTDVAENAWYYAPVCYTYVNKLMSGTNETSFSPQVGLTRAMFVTILARTVGAIVPDTAQNAGFSDVKADSWYGPSVSWAAENGIAAGLGENRFAPNDAVTREQMASMIARYLEKADIDLPDASDAVPVFRDASAISTWAVPGVELMRRTGLLSGDNKANFTPKATATRAEAAVLFMKLHQVLFGGAESTENGNAPEDTPNMQITEAQGELVTQLINRISQMEKNGAGVSEIESLLKSLPWMETVSRTPDGGLCCRTSFGVTGVWTPDQEGYISGPAAVQQEMQLEEQNAFITALDLLSAGYKIVILCPYASVDSDFNLSGYEYLANQIIQCANGSLTVLKDSQVSLEALKDLERYDMVFFYSHGALSNLTNSAWDILNTDPYTMTGEFVDAKLLYLLSDDFLSSRTIINLSDGRIGIGGDFYRYYYGEHDLKDMFFHFGSCYSMHNYDLADALLSRGAAWVQGWSGFVTFQNDYHRLAGNIYFMLNSLTVSESMRLALSVEEVQKYVQKNCDLYGKGDQDYQLKLLVHYGEALVAGMVTDQQGRPVSDADIVFQGPKAEKTYSVKTDRNGFYQIVLMPAEYTVECAKNGYETVNGRLTVEATKIILNMQMKLSHNVTDGVSVSGIVVDRESGIPLSGMTVRYWSEMHPEQTEETVTDAQGRFTFIGKTITEDWWMLDVYDANGYIYLETDNPTASGYDTLDGFCGILYMTKQR